MRGYRNCLDNRGQGSCPELPLAPAGYPLVLLLEHSGFLTQVQIDLFFPWISQVRLGALTRNFPRKQLTTSTKHKQEHTNACPAFLPKTDWSQLWTGLATLLPSDTDICSSS